MTDGWEIATAIFTGASAIFVGVQAWLTRRAIDVSRDALQPAQAVAIEASRARLDTGAPNIRILLQATAKYMLEPSATEHLGGEAQPVEPGREWHFPKDAQQLIALRVEVKLSNLSTDMADLSFTGAVRQFGEHDRAAAFRPPPSMTVYPEVAWVPLYLEARFTAQQWAENHQAWSDGGELPHCATATITCTDRRDEGVIDTYRLRLTGHPIEPVPDRGSVWRRSANSDEHEQGVLDFEVSPPRERTYWVSRSGRVLLPSPIYTRASAGGWQRVKQRFKISRKLR